MMVSPRITRWLECGLRAKSRTNILNSIVMKWIAESGPLDGNAGGGTHNPQQELTVDHAMLVWHCGTSSAVGTYSTI